MKAKELVEKSLQVLKGKLEESPSNTLLKFLDYVRRFHTYSCFNQYLIWWQYPNASLVAGYSRWKKQGRWVRKGERGIRLVAPYTYKKTRKNKEGELVEIDGIYFKTVSVFDVTQTEGKPLPPSPFENMSGNIGIILPLGIKACPFPVLREDSGLTAGIFHNGKIKINKDLSNEASFATLIHEWTHGLLHQGNNDTREQKELEAEAVAYATCSYYGLKSPASYDYLRNWKATPDKMLKSFKKISQSATKVIQSIEVERKKNNV